MDPVNGGINGKSRTDTGLAATVCHAAGQRADDTGIDGSDVRALSCDHGVFTHISAGVMDDGINGTGYGT